jgi:hypothetical protein
MSDKVHIIDINRIVLTGGDLRDPDRLGELIEADVLRALKGLELRASTGAVNSETRVAGEVARAVVRSVQGGADGDQAKPGRD